MSGGRSIRRRISRGGGSNKPATPLWTLSITFNADYIREKIEEYLSDNSDAGTLTLKGGKLNVGFTAEESTELLQHVISEILSNEGINMENDDIKPVVASDGSVTVTYRGTYH